MNSNYKADCIDKNVKRWDFIYEKLVKCQQSSFESSSW